MGCLQIQGANQKGSQSPASEHHMALDFREHLKKTYGVILIRHFLQGNGTYFEKFITFHCLGDNVTGKAFMEYRKQ